MTAYTLTFWTPNHPPADDGRTFGCATHGFAAADRWVNPEQAAVASFGVPVEGHVLAGTYERVLAALANPPVTPRLVIAVFTRPDGMEAFLAALRQRVPNVPVTGGGTARTAGQSRGDVRPGAEDVALLLVTDASLTPATRNLHRATGLQVQARRNGPRAITHLRLLPEGAWQDAATAYRGLQARFGVAEPNFESVALADETGRNIHAFIHSSELHTGADLPAGDTLHVGLLTPAEAAAGLTQFAAAPPALVFGCAGLRGLLPGPVTPPAGTLVTFLFGEVVTPSTYCQFGNLMLAKLTAPAAG